MPKASPLGAVAQHLGGQRQAALRAGAVGDHFVERGVAGVEDFGGGGGIGTSRVHAIILAERGVVGQAFQPAL